MKVVCVDVWLRLLTPLIRLGVFVYDETVGVVPIAIRGMVTVNVVLVNGQNSLLSLGEILCAYETILVIIEAITSVNIFFTVMCFLLF